MACIVLYQSKYGSAKRYAEWISEELSCEVGETGAYSASDLAKYDTIIIGGGVYASGVKGISWLKKNYSSLRNKRIAVFAVGASPYEEKNIAEVAQHSLGDDLAGLPFFYMRGKWDEAHMTWVDRKLCGVLKKSVLKKPSNELVGWEIALVEACAAGPDVATDWASEDQIVPLVDWANHA